MADKFVLLLEFSSGIIEPLPLSTEALATDRIIIAIDELKEKVWLWQGAATSLVERRAAQRKARSILSAGYQLGPYRIGRDVSDVEIIEGDFLDDPDTKALFAQLQHTLSQKFQLTNGVLGRFSDTTSPLPSAPTSTTKPASVSTPPLPSPKPPPPQPSIATPQPQTQPIAPAPQRAFQDLGVIRVGILIASVLDFFSSCYVSTNPTETGIRYTIEDPDGTICEIEVSQGSVHFLQRYDFRGKRNEILALLRDRLSTANL
ncbi:MAG: hypothetical protein ACFE89_01610 [Candidatus Hodarchaeota archaeon]